LPISPASADRFINALNQVAEELRSGRELSSLDAVSGGTPGENAGAVRDVLAGASGPTRDIVTLNAAAGLLAAGAAAVIAGGWRQPGARSTRGPPSVLSRPSSTSLTLDAFA